jgi:hypothetical protein
MAEIDATVWEKLRTSVTPLAAADTPKPPVVEEAAPAEPEVKEEAAPVVEAAPPAPADEDILAVLTGSKDEPAPAPTEPITPVSPLKSLAKEHGVPEDKIEAFEAESLDFMKRVLSARTEADRVSILAEVAKTLQIPVPGLTPEASAQGVKASEEVAALRRELDTLKSGLKEAATREVKATLEAFKSKHPDFDDHRETVGKLLKSGLAPSLDEAYRQARLLSGKSHTSTQPLRNDAAIAAALSPPKQLSSKEASLEKIISKFR